MDKMDKTDGMPLAFQGNENHGITITDFNLVIVSLAKLPLFLPKGLPANQSCGLNAP